MAHHQPDMHSLFAPRSIAVIGASFHKEKIGYRLLDNIVASGYQGQVYPINPRGGEILGLRVYRSVTEVEDEVDIACIAIPAELVFEAVMQCAEKGVKFVPILASGFSEIGHLEAEKRIVSYAHAHNMRVLGPNIFGIYSAKVSLNATFGPREIQPGKVAIITQSGALGIAMIGKTAVEDLGLSAIVSVGNKADIDEADLLEYLIQDEDTGVIMMYIEGIKTGDRLIEVLRRGTKQKPIVVIKVGRSQRGAIAAASHTGSLAGTDAIFDAITRQCGVLRAESLQEAFDWCKFLTDTPLPTGENAVSCFGAMYAYSHHRTAPTDDLAVAAIDVRCIERVAENALKEGRSFLLAPEGQQVMTAAGIPTPLSRIAHNLDEAVASAEEIGYPVVLKIVSRNILHKSDVGGVPVALENRVEVIDAYQAIIRRCRAHQPQAIIEGIEGSEMAPPGIEMIIGARTDVTFGPMVMFGLGGIYISAAGKSWIC